MFCPHCGAQIKVRSELFCAKCGRPTDAALTEGVQPAQSAKAKTLAPSKPISPVGWLLIAMLAVLYAGIGLSIMDRAKISTNQLGGVVIWTGITLAYLRRRQGRSGLLGFGLGLVLAIALFAASSFLVAFLRGVETRGNNSQSSNSPLGNTSFIHAAYVGPGQADTKPRGRLAPQMLGLVGGKAPSARYSTARNNGKSA